MRIIILWAAVIVAFVALLSWWEIASWKQCLGTNSWWYCLRVLSQ